MRKLPADLSETLVRGFRWWSGELTSLLPAGVVSGDRQRKADLIVVALGGTIVSTVPQPGSAPDGEDSILAEISRRAERGPVKVALRLPKSECLVREISVPRVAVKDAGRIAMLDLERATPFREEDVLTAVRAGPAVRGRSTVSVEQIVMKRSRIATLRRRLETAGAELVRVDVYQDDPSVPLGVDLLAERALAGTKPRGILLSAGALTAACGALALAALVITVYRHETALAALREQTAAVRARVAQARVAQETGDASLARALAQLKSQYPPVVVLLDDLSRRLPDTAFVTEFRLADGSLELGGFGRPVRSLAPELEQSPYVSSASITAPITTDEERQKERFNLQLLLNKDWQTDAGARP